MRWVEYRKVGDVSSMTLRGTGTTKVPQPTQDRLNAATDEWLLEHLYEGPFVDPFVLGEVLHRDLYGEAERRRQVKLEAVQGPPRSIMDAILQWAADSDQAEIP